MTKEKLSTRALGDPPASKTGLIAFRAPQHLVELIDQVADKLGIERTKLILHCIKGGMADAIEEITTERLRNLDALREEFAPYRATKQRQNKP